MARCSARYSGRLDASLPLATRLVLVKADGSVLLHSDGGSYKPLNWMSPPCTLKELEPSQEAAERGATAVWHVQHTKTDDRLEIELHEVLHDSSHEPASTRGSSRTASGRTCRPARRADRPARPGAHPRATRVPDGDRSVDILARDPEGRTVAIEIKRRGDIDGSSSSRATSSCSVATRSWLRACVSPRRRSPQRACSPTTVASSARARLPRDARARRPDSRLF